VKKEPRRNILLRAWCKLMGKGTPPHDPLLSLSITVFNFSTGWDRLLRKQGQFLA